VLLPTADVTASPSTVVEVVLSCDDAEENDEDLTEETREERADDSAAGFLDGVGVLLASVVVTVVGSPEIVVVRSIVRGYTMICVFPFSVWVMVVWITRVNSAVAVSAPVCISVAVV